MLLLAQAHVRRVNLKPRAGTKLTYHDDKMERGPSQELQDDEFDAQEHQVFLLPGAGPPNCVDRCCRLATFSHLRIEMTDHQNGAAQ